MLIALTLGISRLFKSGGVVPPPPDPDPLYGPYLKTANNFVLVWTTSSGDTGGPIAYEQEEEV